MNDRIRVLLVDDDEVDALLVDRAVRRTEVDTELIRVQHGAEALELLRSETAGTRPDLIFLDLNMPVMGGLEFLAQLRADPRLRSLVVFVLTTSNHEQDLARAYELGVAGYLIKSNVSPQYGRLVDLIQSYAQVVTLPPT